MGQANTIPRRINGVEGVAGQFKASGGPGVLETWKTPETRLESKADSETRDMEAASGDVSYTGYGFQPRALICFACVDQGIGMSWGQCDSALNQNVIYLAAADDIRAGLANFAVIRSALAKGQDGLVASIDADGLTSTWTKQGAPAAGTAYLTILALR